MRLMQGVRKIIRYAEIYGINRTLYKVAGRSRLNFLPGRLSAPDADIAIVGCGQFAFSTVGYFLQRAYGRRIASCFDIEAEAQKSFARAFGVAHHPLSARELFETPGVRVVFILSNHASHADYAVAAIEKGLDVYIEKPIAVSRVQLVSLIRAMRLGRSRVFAGYNRPFSEAVRLLRREIEIDPNGGISLQCFVSGHKLPADHWYRRPAEGTRVCGNMGHWLDLMVHMFSWRGLPDALNISLTMADEREPDDNLIVSMSSDRGDIFSIMMTSRCEPFEGIDETINIQHGTTTCKIDDFRSITIWRDEKRFRRRFRPKDVGHRLAVLQPFQETPKRDNTEVLLSTLLMLHVADMVRSNTRRSEFSFSKAWASIEAEVAAT